MVQAAAQDRDPVGWCVVIALAFFALGWLRLGLPSKPYFDEVHYVPAARDLLALIPSNREHPLFAKEIIAASIALLGDRPLGWRLPSLLVGTLGLFAFGRLIWWSGRRRFATVAGMILLATAFPWYVQSRIAMLDIFAIGLAVVALWQFAAARHLPVRSARWRLALSGTCLGLALAAKWSVVPLALALGVAALLRAWRAGPAGGIGLVETAFWLGLLPLLVYWTTFAPAFFYADDPVDPLGFIAQHRHMIALQDSVTQSHPYQSRWYHWVINWRPIWYLYEQVDGAQRGVLLLGNPFTMLAGLPALAWCLWRGFARHDRAALGFGLLYLACLGLWLLPAKPIQFYYHYLVPGTFLMACLALALDAMMRKGGIWRIGSIGALLLSAAMFAWFHPILSAAELPQGAPAFLGWMWLDSWR